MATTIPTALCAVVVVTVIIHLSLDNIPNNRLHRSARDAFRTWATRKTRCFRRFDVERPHGFAMTVFRLGISGAGKPTGFVSFDCFPEQERGLEPEYGTLLRQGQSSRRFRIVARVMRRSETV
jgi:hypothetical protein